MAELPKILLLFANPKDDLTSIKKEKKDIVAFLRDAKNKGVCDYDTPFEDEPFENIIKSTSGFQGYTASIFHFSGHANEQQLLLTEDAASVNAICQFLKLIKTKLVFLNGCSTKGFLEKLFQDTDVIAAIATYNKVRDLQAGKLSELFYDQFMRGLNLETIFKNLCSAFEKSVLNADGCNMRDLNIPLPNFPDETKDKFQWGLFYKDHSYYKITIGNLLSKGATVLDELEKQLTTATAALIKAQEELAVLETIKGTPAGLALYNDKKGEVESLTSNLNNLKNNQHSLETEKLNKETLALEHRLSNDFSNAIRRINYYDQEEIYTAERDTAFACFAAVGDEDALIDLLLMRMEEDYNFLDNNHKPIPIDYGSSNFPGFWPALAKYFPDTKPETPAQIAEAIINKLYLGSGITTRQHIFLKVYISPLDLTAIEKLVCDFWTHVHNAWTASAAFAEGMKVNHRIIMVLIDDMSTFERHKQIEAITATVNASLKTKLKPMGWIEPLNKTDIDNWIKSHSLHKFGIKRAMVNEIYTESDGKIRRVLKWVQNNCDMKDLPLFYKLNIFPDDAQTIFGEIGG